MSLSHQETPLNAPKTLPIPTRENYYDAEMNRIYMGSTQFKRFLECESLALAEISGDYREEPSTAMLVGSYVDAHFAGELDIFRAKNPGIFTRNGELKFEYKNAENIIARIERDPVFMEAVSGEQQVVMTGEIEGVPVKIRIDSLLSDRTVDLKIMKDMKDVYIAEDGYTEFWRAWGYQYQAAIYREIRRQNDGVEKPFGLAVATKEKPEPDIALLEIPKEEIDVALHEIRARIVYFDGLKKGLYEPGSCGDCPWCRANRTLKGWVNICA